MTLKPITKVLLSFSAGAIVFAILSSVFTVFVLQWYDAKFQDALFTALQVQLMGMAVFVIVATIVLGVVLMFRVRGSQVPLINTRFAGIAGSVFPVGVLLLGPLLQKVEPESLLNPLIGGAYMLTYPLLVGLVLTVVKKSKA
jgi:uncharacterized protein YacL